MQKVGHHQAHGHGAGVPSTGAKPTKDGGLGGFIVQVKGLRIKLAGKCNDLFASRCDGA